MKRKSTSKTSRKVESKVLRIEYHNEGAEEVCIAGSFNEWQPEKTPMVQLGNGRWRKELSLAPGRYEYLLVVNGQWICDPVAKEKVQNPFGTSNAVLIVPETNEVK